MLSSQKKRNDGAGKGMPAWHPNFRDQGRLPDIKTVRTSFFINALSLSAVAVLLLYTGYREVRLTALTAEAEQTQVDARSSKAGSDSAVAQYKQFQEEERKIRELQTFLSVSKVPVSDFILRVGETLPPEITLRGIDYKPTAVIMRGVVQGAPEEASARAAAYVDALRKDDYYVKLFDSISAKIQRDPTGMMHVVVDMAMKAPPKAAKGKK